MHRVRSISNLVSLATARERGLPFVIIAPAGLYSSDSPATSLLVAKSSQIKTAKDLEGKTVAVNGLRNISEIGASAWLDKNGADVAKVHFIEMPLLRRSARSQSSFSSAAGLRPIHG